MTELDLKVTRTRSKELHSGVYRPRESFDENFSQTFQIILITFHERQLNIFFRKLKYQICYILYEASFQLILLVFHDSILV